jgi:hypothetical protein
LNAVKLMELAIAVAPLMPSEAAIGHASVEWRLARLAWLSAIEELGAGFSEERVREMAGRRLALGDGLADTRTMQ